MKSIKLFVVILWLLASVSCSESKANNNTKIKKGSMDAVSSSSPLEGELKDSVRIIKMEAKNFQFTPKKFYILKGEKVKILIKSTQGNHSIKFEKLDIEKDLPENKEVTIEFTAPNNKAKYNFWCKQHKDMKGYMIAKPD